MKHVGFRLFLISVVAAPMLVTGAMHASTGDADAFITAVATTVWLAVVSFVVTKGYEESEGE